MTGNRTKGWTPDGRLVFVLSLLTIGSFAVDVVTPRYLANLWITNVCNGKLADFWIDARWTILAGFAESPAAE